MKLPGIAPAARTPLLVMLMVLLAGSPQLVASEGSGGRGIQENGSSISWQKEEGGKLDLLVWGATGFTGQWAVEYLIKQYGVNPPNFSWGIGGRSVSKLEQLKANLSATLDPLALTIPVVVGDATDKDSITKVVKSTRVVVTTAGPYAQFGSELVAACVREGVHYGDITGEVLWMQETIGKYHEEAAKNGVKIVHTCGFDSIPSDMGAFMMASYIRDKYQRPTRSVKMVATDTVGGVGGGTIASLVGQVQQASESEPVVWEAFKRDMYLLNPSDNKPGWDKGYGGLGYDVNTGYFQAAFPMGAINSRVVRRSNALQDNAYGAPFSYTECSGAKGVSGLVKTVVQSTGLVVLDLLVDFPPTRAALQKIMPKIGQNPSRELCEKGYFWFLITAEVATEPGEKPIRVMGRLGTNLGDGGYKETGHMLVEAGLTLALDQANTPQRYGVLTPASALGQPLLDRLRRTGMVFEVFPPGSPIPDSIRPPPPPSSPSPAAGLKGEEL